MDRDLSAHVGDVDHRGQWLRLTVWQKLQVDDDYDDDDVDDDGAGDVETYITLQRI